MKKTIAFMIGDPAGIGPEITVQCLKDYKISDNIRILLIGDKSSFDRAQEIKGTDLEVEEVSDENLETAPGKFLFYNVPVTGVQEIPFGVVSAAAGTCVYESLKKIMTFIDNGKVDGFVFAPFNKEGMKMGGCPYTSELEMFKDHFNRPDVNGEINYLAPMWTNRVTSHIAVKDIASFIKKDRVLRSILFLDGEMKRFGVKNPRIAVSALNPHGGEKGLFGTEEIDDIVPAVEAAAKDGVNVSGPYPADTIFLRVKKGEFDGIISMYHDQGQVATKLIGFDSGVTIHGGMPVAIATCAHGTAFDIAGTGQAGPNALIEALKVVLSSVEGQR